jgi:CDGSH-type Zn-finger protein
MSETVVETTPDGPNLVRGPLKMVDAQGNETLLDRPWVALCRCGHSGKKPLCDGTHAKVGFKSPAVNFYRP